MNGVPGASEHALPIKPVDDFIQGWKTIVKRAQETTRQTARRLPRPLRLLVVGGGAGGVELILAMQHGLLSRLAEKGKEGRHLEFQVLTASEEILSTHTPAVRKRIRAILHARNIRVHTQQKVVEVTPTTVECESGSSLPYDALIWTTHASPAPWLAQSGLDTDGEGFLLVNNTLQSTSHPFVFAAGDTAAILDHPTPKAGVFAVRQGPFLAKNLRHALGGEPLETYRPQKTFLSLISTGGKNAIASKGPWSIEGRLVWHLKDWIDRRFMAKYAIRADGPAPNPL